MPQKSMLACVIATILFGISACTAPFVHPPRPSYLTKQASGGAIAGGAVGLWASGLGASPLAAIPGGAVIGGGIGTYLGSTYRYMRLFTQYGIQVVQIGDHLRIIMPSDYLFQPNSPIIRTCAMAELNTVVLFLERYGCVPITISGYTDNVLDPDDALLLSTQQAKSVAGYLWSHGVPYQLVHPYGHGRSCDIATNGNSLGSFYNRRIELTLPVVPMHKAQIPEYYPGNG